MPPYAAADIAADAFYAVATVFAACRHDSCFFDSFRHAITPLLLLRHISYIAPEMLSASMLRLCVTCALRATIIARYARALRCRRACHYGLICCCMLPLPLAADDAVDFSLLRYDAFALYATPPAMLFYARPLF